METVSEIQLFTCPRHPGELRITLNACAELWRRWNTVTHVDKTSHCQGCALGAKHAQAPLPLQARLALRPTCACCGRSDLRYVPSRALCISCYNRELEIKRGYDRRKNPLKGRSIAPVCILDINGQQVRRPSKSLLAMTLWALRSHPGAVISRGVPHGSAVQGSFFPGIGGRMVAKGVMLHGG